MRTTAIVDHSSSITFTISVLVSSAFHPIIYLGLYRSYTIFIKYSEKNAKYINILLTRTLVMLPERQIF